MKTTQAPRRYSAEWGRTRDRGSVGLFCSAEADHVRRPHGSRGKSNPTRWRCPAWLRIRGAAAPALGCACSNPVKRSRHSQETRTSLFTAPRNPPRAALNPVFMAAPNPRFDSCSMTVSPGNRERMRAAVPSSEPSSTMMSSADAAPSPPFRRWWIAVDVSSAAFQVGITTESRIGPVGISHTRRCDNNAEHFVTLDSAASSGEQRASRFPLAGPPSRFAPRASTHARAVRLAVKMGKPSRFFFARQKNL